nr:GGDEF domain-containing protein [Desulfobaculum xiamenense]
MERTRHELARLAAVDPLTGLRNRRMFMELARREFDKAKRYDTPLACVMIDVDRFKDINDTHGHEAGDRALKAIATELARHARRTDILARLGGEEFILLLPETGLHGAFVSAEQHRQRIEELSIPLAPEPLEITISLGVTELDEADSSLDALMSRADHALYAAKAKGRNRTECLPPCTDAQPNADVPAD